MYCYYSPNPSTPGTICVGNEWKTRFETQEEMNQQLERQMIMLQDKIEEAKRNLKDGMYKTCYKSSYLHVLG